MKVAVVFRFSSRTPELQLQKVNYLEMKTAHLQVKSLNSQKEIVNWGPKKDSKGEKILPWDDVIDWLLVASSVSLSQTVETTDGIFPEWFPQTLTFTRHLIEWSNYLTRGLDVKLLKHHIVERRNAHVQPVTPRDDWTSKSSSCHPATETNFGEPVNIGEPVNVCQLER